MYPSINLSIIYISIYPSIYVSIYLCIHLSMYPSIYVSIYLCIHLSMYPSIYVYIYLCIHLSMYPSIYVSIYLSIHLSISPSTFYIFLNLRSQSYLLCLITNILHHFFFTKTSLNEFTTQKPVLNVSFVVVFELYFLPALNFYILFYLL